MNDVQTTEIALQKTESERTCMCACLDEKLLHSPAFTTLTAQTSKLVMLEEQLSAALLPDYQALRRQSKKWSAIESSALTVEQKESLRILITQAIQLEERAKSICTDAASLREQGKGPGSIPFRADEIIRSARAVHSKLSGTSQVTGIREALELKLRGGSALEEVTTVTSDIERWIAPTTNYRQPTLLPTTHRLWGTEATLWRDINGVAHLSLRFEAALIDFKLNGSATQSDTTLTERLQTLADQQQPGVALFENATDGSAVTLSDVSILRPLLQDLDVEVHQLENFALRGSVDIRISLVALQASESTWKNVSAYGVDFTCLDAAGARFTDCQFIHCTLLNADLRGALFEGARSSLRRSNLRHVLVGAAKAGGTITDFGESVLVGANLTKLQGESFRHALLDDALRGTKHWSEIESDLMSLAWDKSVGEHYEHLLLGESHEATAQELTTISNPIPFHEIISAIRQSPLFPNLFPASAVAERKEEDCAIYVVGNEPQKCAYSDPIKVPAHIQFALPEVREAHWDYDGELEGLSLPRFLRQALRDARKRTPLRRNGHSPITSETKVEKGA